MSQIPDFTDKELHIVRDMLAERYGEPIEPQLADVEIQLDADDAAQTACPALFWRARDANLIVLKTAEARYRSQFFYDEHTAVGTSNEDCEQLESCISTLLQVQADDERTRKMSAE